MTQEASGLEFTKVVARRRMVRNYTGESIDPEILNRVLSIALKSPSAGFSQGQSMVVVTDPATKLAVAEIVGEPRYVANGFDPWISRSGAIVVCCTSEKLYRDRYSEPDKLGPDGKPIEWPIPYWYVDAGGTMMLLLLGAVDEGLAAGFLGCSADGYTRLRELLSIPEHVTPIGLVTIGHPAPDRVSSSLKRGRRPTGQVIHRERWSTER